MAKPRTNTTTVQVTLRQKQADALKSIASRTDIVQTELIRQAVDLVIEANPDNIFDLGSRVKITPKGKKLKSPPWLKKAPAKTALRG